ncbi:3-dehydroquinate synthase [Bartonella tamiae]|uniref:3-dehydroquinate synthase n=1 Tax=Bartonella tamiae Th239 TaxID=1094558 RepID=J1K0R6_9HYPH|nr:3-dehydroquinate synthase [Bartonella tamiae]EJF91012.1 3-dehydroquinate synthase [Bartonella tamiae Th239]EJF93323.1 3-dehydroquinate synthase [Bartonella tamiae Th307]
MTHLTVPVGLGTRSYDILIGPALLTNIGQEIKQRFLGEKAGRVAIVSDDKVAAHHLENLSASLRDAHIPFTPIIVGSGEKSKSFETLQYVVNALLEARLERSDFVLALGGGVVGDLAGFASAIVRRGMNFIQIPTSLLAQVDSSVGGKTGINTAHGKNLVGAFYQPRLVIADSDVLETLPLRQFRAGYAEVVKYGLINQPDFFHWLDTHWKEVFSGGPARMEAIARSCQSKADIVERDEREAGERALLNLGHTFGHALETATNYNAERLVHGEGVSIGIVLAYQFSAYLNLCSPDVSLKVEAHLQKVGLPTTIQDVPGSLPNAEKFLDIIGQDKKVSRGLLTFILTHNLGECFVAENVAPTSVLSFLKQKLGETS